MLYEFQQVNATGNGSSTTCLIVQNPRIENGMNVADVVGVFAGFSSDTKGEYVYKVCAPKKMVFGGNFTMIEYTKGLISDDSIKR